MKTRTDLLLELIATELALARMLRDLPDQAMNWTQGQMSMVKKAKLVIEHLCLELNLPNFEI